MKHKTIVRAHKRRIGRKRVFVRRHFRTTKKNYGAFKFISPWTQYAETGQVEEEYGRERGIGEKPPTRFKLIKEKPERKPRKEAKPRRIMKEKPLSKKAKRIEGQKRYMIEIKDKAKKLDVDEAIEKHRGEVREEAKIEREAEGEEKALAELGWLKKDMGGQAEIDKKEIEDFIVKSVEKGMELPAFSAESLDKAKEFLEDRPHLGKRKDVFELQTAIAETINDGIDPQTIDWASFATDKPVRKAKKEEEEFELLEARGSFPRMKRKNLGSKER